MLKKEILKKWLFLETGVNPDAILKSGWTALLHAADCGNLEILDILLQSGANASFQKGLCVLPNHLKIVKSFLLGGESKFGIFYVIFECST